MRVFLTGASGWIGSAVVPELLNNGHEVLGLARSDESAAAVAALGADVHRGSLDDLESLRAGAVQCEGVIQLGYNHDFSDMAGAAKTDLAAIELFGDVLEGTGGPLVVAAGVLGLSHGRPATELDTPEAGVHPRFAGIQLALSLSDRGVRSSAVRFAPTVHGDGDHGFMATLVAIARNKGVSGYIEDGSNRWPAVHRFDAANLVRLTMEKAVAGTSVHAVAEEGVPTKSIAEAIGEGLGLPVRSIPTAEANDHFGWMAMFFGIDSTSSSAITRQSLGWTPTNPGLIDDLSKDYYFRRP
ncbi:MAG TPA: SDR family oxidoreductase [Acidimicrobiales bacterium]